MSEEIAEAPRLSLTRLSLAAVTFVAALVSILYAISDGLVDDYPGFAATIDGNQAAARIVAAQARYADQSDIAAARAEAIGALNVNPMTPSALTFLARVAEDAGDPGKAKELMTVASRVNQRDRESQLWLLAHAVRAGDIAEVMRRVDVLLRGQDGSVAGPLVKVMAPLLTSDQYRLPFIKLLSTRPKWGVLVLKDLAAQSNDPRGLAALLADLQASVTPPSREVLKAFLDRFLAKGLWDEAYLAWARSLPRERLQKLGLLYNGSLDYPVTNLPFDWVFDDIPGALINTVAVTRRHLLNVDFFGGRVSFAHVSHLLALPPGLYRFSGMERAQNLRNERGLRWSLACARSLDAPLATSALLTGDVDWRPLEMNFEIPARDCAYQRLRLELPARVALETEIIGGVSYADLSIAPITDGESRGEQTTSGSTTAVGEMRP